MLYALILGDDVPATTVNHFRQQAFVLFELGGRDITQGLDFGQGRGKQLYALLALRAAHIVFSACNLVLDSGIANSQQNARRNRQSRGLKRPAIEHERMIGTAVRRDELVHNSDAGADEFVLCLAASQSKFRETNFGTAGVQQSVPRGNFNGGR